MCVCATSCVYMYVYLFGIVSRVLRHHASECVEFFLCCLCKTTLLSSPSAHICTSRGVCVWCTPSAAYHTLTVRQKRTLFYSLPSFSRPICSLPTSARISLPSFPPHSPNEPHLRPCGDATPPNFILCRCIPSLSQPHTHINHLSLPPSLFLFFSF